jgi:hypothetical protein
MKNSIVLVGPAATNSRIGAPYKPHSYNEALSLYGDSPVITAYKECAATGADNIYILNTRKMNNYIEAASVLMQNDFGYIVPVDINFSDTFYNPNLQKQIPYLEHYLYSLGQHTKSIIIMSDLHADTFVDLDSFKENMAAKINRIIVASGAVTAYGRNAILVANMLATYKYANSVLAGALSVGEFSYPEFDFGPTTFDMDENDIGDTPLVYFRDNLLREATAENLYNLRPSKDADRFVPIDMAVRYIQRNLDLSQYKGKLYTEYIKLLIYNNVSSFLTNIVGKAVRSFSILSIDFVGNKNYSGVITVRISFVPMYCAEEFEMTLEV